MIYVITFPHFESIVAQDLTASEVRQVREIKDTMSSDEYAGYSPEEQKKLNRILGIVRPKMVPTARI